MPKLTVGDRTIDVSAGRRSVLAIEDLGVQIGHRCGGNARCTTCRVTFVSGEPTTMTVAEYEKLKERELLGEYRLACQIVCSHDIEVVPVMTLENQGWSDTGPTPDETVKPEAVFVPRDELV
ncbi:MAG TPA: 2Fe-2S iron-sulfur cluster-binding protein [Roseiflexaceae bacterium]|nr:2Fe-2S iron-sulfur cluster-binding protein [Roseiflexaceae bacterium]